MASAYLWKRLTDFRGGRDQTNDPLSLKDNQVVEMRNGDTYRTGLFRKRSGAAAPSIGAAFTGVISSLLAHFPTNDPAAAELWGVDDAATPIVGRMAAASTFSAVTMTDSVSASYGAQVRGASYQGKHYLAYKSAQDRMHVYDPNLGTARVRRLNLAKPSAPTAAASATPDPDPSAHYYRQRYRIKHGSIVDAESEPSASSAQYNNANYATVTKSATISESETHWVVEGSKNGVTWYELAEVAVGTGTWTETFGYGASATYASNPLSPDAGLFANHVSVKYILAAFNRLFLFGSHTSTNAQSRLWYTPANGELDQGDTERFVDSETADRHDWTDLNEGTGGDARGLVGPFYGSIIAFKFSQIHKGTPTGATSPALDTIELSLTYGAVEQECIVMGTDANGRPTIYFLDPQVGPCALTAGGVTEIGEGVRDLWDTVNLSATTKVGEVIDVPQLGQVWFWWATGSNNDPNLLTIYNKRTSAWSVADTGGKIRLARCAVMFAKTLGASMSKDRVPYVGHVSSNNTLLRGLTTDTDDSTTTFQALVKTKPYLWNNGQPFRTTAPWILAKAASGVTLTVTADKDFGLETRSTTIDLTPTGTETRVWRQAVDLDFRGATALQIQVGDSAAISNTWQIEQIFVPVMADEGNP